MKKNATNITITDTVVADNSIESTSEPKRFVANKDRKHYKPKFVEEKSDW